MASKKDPQQAAEEFASEMRHAFGNELQALFLVGSAARGDFVHGKSDINTLVILTDEGMEWLEKAYPILKSWRKKGLAVPHFMMPSALQKGLDSYPLEFLDFRAFHRVIIGPDLLADIKIPAEPLRLQIERELRGKLFLLRQIFAAEAGIERHLQVTLSKSVSVLTAVFQGILELHGQPIPADRRELFETAARLTSANNNVLQRVLETKRDGGKKNLRVIYKELLNQIGLLVRWADQFQAS